MSPEYQALLVERFGTVAELAREARRLPAPRELARRRRVLAAAMSKDTNHKEQAA